MLQPDSQLFNLKRKVQQYEEVLQNTQTYRENWKTETCKQIQDTLQDMLEATGFAARLEHRSDVENLEAIVLTLGQSKSGMYQRVSEDVQRHLIKHNGSLVYQQLFNGKIIVLINYPFIENYGQPRPPKTIAIYRPEELKEPYFLRHMEEFLQEITNWEDYDDDEPNSGIIDCHFDEACLEGTGLKDLRSWLAGSGPEQVPMLGARLKPDDARNKSLNPAQTEKHLFSPQLKYKQALFVPASHIFPKR